MANGYYDRNDEEIEENKRNIFRCALSHIAAIIGAADITIGAFIHKALLNSQTTVVSS